MKERFIETLKPKLPFLEEDDDRAKESPEDSAGASTTTILQFATESELEKFLDSVKGKYSNPAYGTMEVSHPSPSAERYATTYMPWIEQSHREERDERRSRPTLLPITPDGHRTWKYIVLLHVQNDSMTTEQKAKNASTIRTETVPNPVFFTMEYLTGHGNTEDDTVPGFPTGAEVTLGNNTSDGICRAEKVWLSQTWTRYGAAFKFDHGQDDARQSLAEERESPRAQSFSMGLRLGTAHLSVDGTDKAGWEKEMVWFTRCEDA